MQNLFPIFSIHVFILISNEKELIEIRNYLKYWQSEWRQFN